MFHSLPCDTETALRQGQNSIHMLAEIGQPFISCLYNSNHATLNAKERKKHTQKQHEKTIKMHKQQ